MALEQNVDGRRDGGAASGCHDASAVWCGNRCSFSGFHRTQSLCSENLLFFVAGKNHRNIYFCDERFLFGRNADSYLKPVSGFFLGADETRVLDQFLDLLLYARFFQIRR